ncbi:MAG: nickel/cobalt transporter [Parvibaculum sp.]|nr:nickel/cobalt transporter [Parvibaculum sp.]MBO6679582.1 nickel/cobalt transporter [Parvibaculum sp.]MBO6686059.1 nickel/cobalt transporter [Parvibaculum sp.]MBO6905000.1 nickel/cobalt transporter [Parvibaculum sp.]
MKPTTIVLLLLAISCFIMPEPAVAQSPFALPGSSDAPPPPEPGFMSSAVHYIMAMQQEYYRALAGALRAVNLQQSMVAVWGLVSISFLYGIFHAAGPGHGKIVVTSYLLADERELRRGILIAFLSAFAQAVTAIAVVGLLAVIIGMTQRATADAVPLIERASFVLIAGVGVWLLWRAVTGHQNHHHHHDHDGHDHHGHDHAHIPTPAEIRTANGIKGMAAMILSVGLRPCSGAILVLLFAVTQGAFAVGVLSAVVMSVGTAITVSALAILTVLSKNLALRAAGKVDSPWAHRVERGLKIAGGAALVILGLLLLAGSLTSPPQPFF